MDVGQVLQNLGVVDGGMAVSDRRGASLRAAQHHEQVGRPVALVFVVAAGRASRLHRDRQPRLGDELLGGLVQTYQRLVGIARPRVDRQHVLHRRDECGVGLGRDDPVLAAVGLERIFLSTRPIVLSLARSTMPNSTTLLSSSRKAPAGIALGRFGAGQSDQPGFLLAVENPRQRPASPVALRLKTASSPSSTSCLRTR